MVRCILVALFPRRLDQFFEEVRKEEEEEGEGGKSGHDLIPRSDKLLN